MNTPTTRRVSTQAELDAALSDASLEEIIIESSSGIWLHLSSSGSATVSASGSATVSAYGSATVRAYDSATVRAYDSATVRASDSATVRASGSATVSAYDSATVRASDSATVSASSHVAVHLHSARVKVTGGVVIDVTELDLTLVSTWIAYSGVELEPDGDTHVIVYKAVNANTWMSGYGFEYRPGQTVTDPKWRDDNGCGGGLHFGPTPAHADAYLFGDDKPARYLACRVAVADLRPIPGGTAKCKAPSCEVLYEVDIHGRRVEDAASVSS